MDSHDDWTALHYRPVQWNDLPALANLYAELVAEVGVEYPRQVDPANEWLACVVSDNPDIWIGEVAVLNADINGFGEPTGGLPVAVLFAILEERRFGAPHFIGVADWLYVHPTYRSQRIAPRLMKAVMARAKAAGVQAVEATTWPGSRAEKQWQRFGFQAFASRARLTGRGQRWFEGKDAA
jgi:GNAT superfamily N-acetyltransferase